MEEKFITLTNSCIYPKQGVLLEKGSTDAIDLLMKDDIPHLAVAIPESSHIAICTVKGLIIFNQMTKCADQIINMPKQADAICCDKSEVTLVAASTLMQFSPKIKDNSSMYELVMTAELSDMIKIEHLVKIEEGIFALFDAKGKLSFITLDSDGTISTIPLKNKIESQ